MCLEAIPPSEQRMLEQFDPDADALDHDTDVVPIAEHPGVDDR